MDSWIARTAPLGVIGFEVDKRFAESPASPLSSGWIKITLFDVLAGTVSVTQAHQGTDGTPLAIGSLPTTGDGALKTLTIGFGALPIRNSGSSEPFDFEVRACPPILTVLPARLLSNLSPILASSPHACLASPHLPSPPLTSPHLTLRPFSHPLLPYFQVRATSAAGSTQALVLSMVRIIKTPMNSPPPPPLMPGTAYVTIHKTIVTMTAAGDVSDYDDTVKAGLATKFAELAGVDPSAVAVTVRPASVIIEVAITVADASAATALVSTISTQLSSADAASAFTGLTITSAPSVKAVAETVLVQPSQGLAPWVIALIVVSSTVVVLLLGVAIACRRAKRSAKTGGAATEGERPLPGAKRPLSKKECCYVLCGKKKEKPFTPRTV